MKYIVVSTLLHKLRKFLHISIVVQVLVLPSCQIFCLLEECVLGAQVLNVVHVQASHQFLVKFLSLSVCQNGSIVFHIECPVSIQLLKLIFSAHVEVPAAFADVIREKPFGP